MPIKVNGELIPQDAIDFELNRLIRFYADHKMPEDQIRAQMPLLLEKAQEQAIGAKLLIDESKRLDIKVSDEEVDGRLVEMIDQLGGQEKYEAMLKQQNLQEAALKDNIRQGSRVDKLVATVTEGLEDPTEEEIEAHFEAHKDEYQTAERVQAQHILVKVEDSENKEEHGAAKSKIEEIRERVSTNLDSFADEAGEHSDCPSGKQAGGSLGWFSPGMMVKEFNDAVFSMEVGELSEVVETQFGFHIMMKTGAEEAKSAELSEVAAQIRDLLRHATRGSAIAQRVEELREKAEIEITPDS